MTTSLTAHPAPAPAVGIRRRILLGQLALAPVQALLVFAPWATRRSGRVVLTGWETAGSWLLPLLLAAALAQVGLLIRHPPLRRFAVALCAGLLYAMFPGGWLLFRGAWWPWHLHRVAAAVVAFTLPVVLLSEALYQISHSGDELHAPWLRQRALLFAYVWGGFALLVAIVSDGGPGFLHWWQPVLVAVFVGDAWTVRSTRPSRDRRMGAVFSSLASLVVVLLLLGEARASTGSGFRSLEHWDQYAEIHLAWHLAISLAAIQMAASLVVLATSIGPRDAPGGVSDA